MKNRMDKLWAMQVFTRVVECGSFSRAAESLDIANATVTASVRNLETYLGVTLLSRNTRTLRLTDPGERFFHQCVELLRHVAEAEAEVMEQTGSIAGQLRIESPAAFGKEVIAPLLAEFGPPRLWSGADPVTPRMRLVGLALRPAPVTDQWVAEGPGLGDLISATDGLALIEADQPQQEAEAIALAMREAVAAGRPVTLIAADRGLTRRVTAALDRWRLIPDDSAGRPLSLSATGLFLRQLAGLNGRALAVDSLLILLKNQRVAMADRGEHLRHARDLELHLRARGPAFPDAGFLRFWGDFFVGLAHGGRAWWVLALGPYALIMLARGARAAWRQGARE